MQIITDRRNLHQIPELEMYLPKTMEYLYRALSGLKCRVFSPMESALCAYFDFGKVGTIAFRADCDALPIEEKTGLDFASTHPGRMHACGHDGHMANLLMFAREIAGRRAELDRDVVLVFQAAEESYGGAEPMIKEGLLHNPEVGEIYGMHVMPYFPVGKAAFVPGPLMAAVETVTIHIQGYAAHGATPHAGNDAVMAMAQFCTTIQAALRRRIDAFQPTVFTIGHVTAGSVPNIIAESADLECTLRCYDEGVREQMHGIIRAALDAADALYGTKSEMEISTFYPAVINDAKLSEQLRQMLGDRYMSCQPMTIAEDFSFYQQEVPGVFVFLGVGDENHKEPLHSDTFDFDEAALLHGVKLFEQILFGKEG